jgi:membrane-associated phospholipid phosphatase
MTQRFATVLSYLLHPVVYPILGLLITLKALPYYINSQITILALAFVFTGTYIFPLAVSFLLYRFDVISSFEMKKREDRKWPYVIGAISYYFTASFIQEIGLPNESYAYVLASAMVVVVHLIMLSFSKPSAHLAGIGGFTGLMMAVSYKYQIGFLPYIALCIILAGFLGSARLKLNAHTLGEVVFGYFSGMFIILITVYLS